MRRGRCGFSVSRRAGRSLSRAVGLLCGIGALAVTACARLPSGAATPHMIHAQVDRVSQTGPTGDFTTGSWPRGNWWHAFGDEALNRLMVQALGTNPDLAAAQARIAAARAAVRDARSRLLPHVGAAVDLAEEHFSATGTHSLLNGRSVLFGNLEPVQAVYDPDISGEGARKLAAAVGEMRVRQAQEAAARLDISTNLARVWFVVAGLDGALAAEGRELVLTRRLLVVHNARLDAGLADADDVFATKQALAALRRRIRLQEGQRSALLAAVAALAGQSPAATSALRPLPPLLRPFPVPADLPLGLLRHRPDVMASLWRVEAARQDVHAARAAFNPQLNLALFAGWNSIHVEDLLNPANFARGIGLSLSLPIFEGGALRAGLEGAQSRYDLAIHRYNARVLAAVKEVAAGVALWKANREALGQSRGSTAAAQARARLRNAAFHAGLTNALPSLTAAIAAAEQREREAQQRAAAAQSWVDLVGALGGGYHGDGPTSARRHGSGPSMGDEKEPLAQARHAADVAPPSLE